MGNMVVAMCYGIKGWKFLWCVRVAIIVSYYVYGLNC